jgi:hypothetical protein
MPKFVFISFMESLYQKKKLIKAFMQGKAMNAVKLLLKTMSTGNRQVLLAAKTQLLIVGQASLESIIISLMEIMVL